MSVTITHTTPADSSFSTQGATAWNATHSVSGLGTMATQDANNVAITGGAIDGTTVGATTPAAATFTTLTATGQTSLGGAAGSEGLRVTTTASANRWVQVSGGQSGVSSPSIGTAGGSTAIDLYTNGGGTFNFYTNGNGSARQVAFAHTASAVNYVQVTGAATTGIPRISAQGSDSTAALAITAKSNTLWLETTSGFGMVGVTHTAGANNYLALTGGVNNPPVISAASGTNANIPILFQSKGTGAIDLAAGSSGVNISNGGTVTAATVTNAGTTAYSSIPAVAISAPTTAGGVQATASALMRASTGATTLASGGTGYTAGDVLTLSGGVFGTAAQITVNTVSAGVIATFTVSNSGAGYSTLPTNPVSVTGGTGTGATFNVSWFVNTLSITNAGSGYVEQPTVSFSGGGGSGAAAYATVGAGTVIRALGSTGTQSLDFNTPQSLTSAIPTMRIRDNVSDSYPMVNNTAGQAGLFAQGATNANFGIGAAASGSVRLYTNGTSQTLQFVAAHTASAVNYVQVTGAATTAQPIISAQGSDTNIPLGFYSKGNQAFNFYTNNGAQRQFRVTHTTSAVNFGYVTGGAAGVAVTFGVDALSSDTNIDLALTPKGTGRVQFGTYTANMALTVQGYIEIKDSGGTVRKLAVIA